MLSVWSLYLVLPVALPLSRHVTALTGDNVKATPQLDTDIPPSTQRLHGSGSTAVNALVGSAGVNFLGLPLSWPSSPSEESDRQGVIGEYVDLHESTETTLLYPYEDLIFRSTESEAEDATSMERTQPRASLLGAVQTQQYQELTLNYQPAEISTKTILHSTQPREDQLTLPALQDKTTESHSPFLMSGSVPSNTPDQESTSPLSAEPRPSPDHPSPTIATGSWGWSTDYFQVRRQEESVLAKETGDGTIHIPNHRVNVGVEAEKDNSSYNGRDVVTSSSTLLPDGNMDTSETSCKTANESWTPAYPDDFTSTESPLPPLALSPALYVPLHSDWNSALATWGFAWEAHIYGLGSVFTVFGLISVVCLLGLPLRCPAGSPYFTLLYLFILAFTGIQAFCLLYDAYSHQDRLPPLGALLLTELPFPCLISAFSLAFLLLSLRSRMRLSLPLTRSTSFSALPNPRLLLCVSLLHFGVSLGCVGLLQLFHILPTMLLLLPQGVFVCLTTFLALSYLIFYCLIRVDTKHIYRLNDNGESGGSPEVMGPSNCPFAKEEDWHRAAGAGAGASLCLLGCGGLQLYGILHALGFGGVDGYGFQPWPWWGFHVGCRLCEAGVCLGLSLIGTHPLFCHNNNSIKTMSYPRPGSWSRLSCSSPSRELAVPSHEDANSSVLSSRNSWSRGKQKKLVVPRIVTKGQSEALPLSSVVDHSGIGLESFPKSSQKQTSILPLPSPQRSSHKCLNVVDSRLSSLDSLDLETDSTVDLRPPSPIDLSRSIDQALFSESLFSHSLFGMPRLFHASSSHSLSSPGQGTSKQGPSSLENALYRTSSCGNVDHDKTLLSSRCSQAHSPATCHSRTPEQRDWKGSVSGSTQGLCSNPKETGKLRSHSWANRGQHFAQHSLPRAIPHLSYHRHYRTLSLASKDIRGSGRLAGTKILSESKQLELDLAVQAEFVSVCKQIDALSVCSDTIEL